MMAKKGNMFLDWADDNPALAAIFGATFFIYAPLVLSVVPSVRPSTAT